MRMPLLSTVEQDQPARRCDGPLARATGLRGGNAPPAQVTFWTYVPPEEAAQDTDLTRWVMKHVP
jgi:hypothetical protein